MKFVRGAAADGAGMGLDRPEFEADAGEDARIGLEHLLIGLLQRCLVQMKRVGIFHQKLARAHDTEAWAHLIAELGLDLIEVRGQLPIAADLAPDEVGDDLLMGRAEAEVPVMAVG